MALTKNGYPGGFPSAMTRNDGCATHTRRSLDLFHAEGASSCSIASDPSMGSPEVAIACTGDVEVTNRLPSASKISPSARSPLRIATTSNDGEGERENVMV